MNSLDTAVRSCKRSLFVAGVFSVAVNLLMLTVPLYMIQVFDRVLSSGSVDTLVMLTIIALGATLFSFPPVTELTAELGGIAALLLGAWLTRDGVRAEDGRGA